MTRVCPTCHGDGTVTVAPDHRSSTQFFAFEKPCPNPRCYGGELEPAGESVVARAERERAMQGPGLGAWGEEAGDV